ncbi:MAG: cell division protein SepF [Eubacteriales bacterium]|nr:cell division protein SepF [Eubacteriales bacterium]
MASMWDKMKQFFTGEGYEEDYDDMEEYEEDVEREPARQYSNNVTSLNRYSNDRRGSNSVVNISTQMEVCMLNPTTLEEAAEACIELKKRNVVVVNLEKIDLETSQQISDFLSGVVYALDGSMELISSRIIIVAPVNVEMSGELKDRLQASGIKISNSIGR